MKLLLENWRKYLNEDEAEYFPWLRDLPEEPFDLVLADRLRARLQSGDDRFNILGSGAFRTVWTPRGDDEHVIKVAHDLDDHKLQMNKDDFETSKRYPLIFPKAYAHANDFEWIVMETITPVKDPDAMQKVLDRSFAKEQEAIRRLGAEGSLPPNHYGRQYNLADPFDMMKLIMASFRFERSDTPEAKERSAKVKFPDIKPARLLQKAISPVAGRAYQELSKAMHEFPIDKHELGKGNIGHDTDYNFKIIDASVFPPEEW